MNDSLGVAVVAGLGGMVGWGSADFFAKRTIDEVGDVTTLFWSQLIGVVPLVVIFACTQNVPTTQTPDQLYLVLFGVMSAISYLPLYRAFGKGRLSVISPIFTSYAGVVVLLSAVLFGEQIPEGQWLALGVIFIGVLLISTDPHDLGRILRGGEAHASTGVPDVLSALAMYSVWLVLLDQFLNGRDWVLFLLVIRSIAALTLFVFARSTGRSLQVGDPALWRFLVLIGVFDVAAFSLVSYGFSQSTHTSVIAVLSSTFSVPTLILAAVFLRERLTTPQKLAVGTILSGVVLITVL